MFDLEEIVGGIVSNGFPELSGLAITIEYRKLKGAYGDWKKVSVSEYHIRVDKSLKKAPEKVVYGLVAHEIAHVYRKNSSRYGSLITLINAFKKSKKKGLKKVFKKCATEYERDVDRLVVERGYGPYLLAFVEYPNKRRKKYKKKDGLTARELRKMLKRKN